MQTSPRTPTPVIGWNWRVGVVFAVGSYSLCFLLSRLAAVANDSTGDTMPKTQFVLVTAGVAALAVAVFLVRNDASHVAVIGLTLVGGLLTTLSLAQEPLADLDELKGSLVYEDATLTVFGGRDFTGRRTPDQGIATLRALALASGPVLASALVLGLRRREGAEEGDWNWGAGAVGALGVIVAWQTLVVVVGVVAAPNRGNYKAQFAAGGSSAAIAMCGAVLLVGGAAIMLRDGARRGLVVGLAVAGGVIAAVAPIWMTHQRWNALDVRRAESFASLQRQAAELERETIAKGEVWTPIEPLEGPAPKLDISLPGHLLVYTQWLGPGVLGLLVLGLRREQVVRRVAPAVTPGNIVRI